MNISNKGVAPGGSIPSENCHDPNYKSQGQGMYSNLSLEPSRILALGRNALAIAGGGVGRVSREVGGRVVVMVVAAVPTVSRRWQ